jgi:hypothetical protein
MGSTRYRNGQSPGRLLPASIPKDEKEGSPASLEKIALYTVVIYASKKTY